MEGSVFYYGRMIESFETDEIFSEVRKMFLLRLKFLDCVYFPVLFVHAFVNAGIPSLA
jgi:hypothetical protein